MRSIFLQKDEGQISPVANLERCIAIGSDSCSMIRSLEYVVRKSISAHFSLQRGVRYIREQNIETKVALIKRQHRWV